MSAGGFRALLTAMEAGLRPVGPVIGAVSYQTTLAWTCGAGVTGSGRRFKLNPDYAPVVYEEYEHALRSAWHTAVERLEADATRLGAHGVVGVDIRREQDGAGLQLQLVGSAVIAPGVRPLARPFLSTASWQDTLKLLLAGWVPNGVAVGVSAVHLHGWSFSGYRSNASFSNIELPEATAGLMLARQRAQWSASRPLVGGGERMVASTIELERSESPCMANRGMLVEGLVVGTTVTRYREAVARPMGARDLTGTARG